MQNPFRPARHGGDDPSANMLVSVTRPIRPRRNRMNDGHLHGALAGDLTAALTVTLRYRHRDDRPDDYQAVALTVTIPAGMPSATVKIAPLSDTTAKDQRP